MNPGYYFFPTFFLNEVAISILQIIFKQKYNTQGVTSIVSVTDTGVQGWTEKSGLIIG
ncbi:hypothetical protein [Methanospirillum lacunae]|uniref:hypothetical protein n=1 Tax=Methanospirillum lacunae TaxID=668570 RepID=UPI0026A3FD5D